MSANRIHNCGHHSAESMCQDCYDKTTDKLRALCTEAIGQGRIFLAAIRDLVWALEASLPREKRDVLAHQVRAYRIYHAGRMLCGQADAGWDPEAAGHALKAWTHGEEGPDIDRMD